MQGWGSFYEMLGGAAATLLGLLFVSVSLNAEIILGATHQHARRLAEQAFQNYMAVLIISLLVLFPGMSVISFGYSVLWTTGFWGLWVLYRMYQVLAGPAPKRETRLRALRRYIPSFFGFGALMFAGYRMTRSGDYTILTAVGVLILLISATVASWELLIKVAEEKYTARKD